MKLESPEVTRGICFCAIRGMVNCLKSISFLSGLAFVLSCVSLGVAAPRLERPISTGKR